MAIGFDCKVYRGGEVAYEKKKHPRFPHIVGGEQLVALQWHDRSRGYDSDLMMLFGWLESKKVEAISLSGYPCLFSVHAGWIRAYGIAIPEEIPNDEALWVEMWDQS